MIATRSVDMRTAGNSTKAKARAKAKGSRGSRDFAAGVGRALRWRPKDARRIARTHGTPIYVWKNGKLVAIKP
jgi:hypothetical protein